MNSKNNSSSGLATHRNSLLLATVLLALLCATVAPIGPAAADVQGSVGGGSGTVINVCQPLGHVTVRSRKGVASVVRNDNFGGFPECLSVWGAGPGFTVSKSAIGRARHRVIAFPNIFTGCSWGVCAPASALPARVPALHNPAASWHISSRHAAGRWNAAFDLWFAKRSMTTGQADGAELMIWLSARGLPLSSKRVVRIDHVRWYLVHWVANHHAGTTWNYIQFRRVHPVAGVTGLKLAPFIRAAERLRWISPSWWLLNIEAGFEIWTGGEHLATKSFSATV